MSAVTAIVAVRGGIATKSRLAAVLAHSSRERLVRGMLTNVLRALATPVIDRVCVVTPTPWIAEQAARAGADVVRDDGTDINGAFCRGRDLLTDDEERLALLMPADLPDIATIDVETLVRAAAFDTIVASPTADGGTSALLFCARSAFRPCFGEDSFAAHRRAARAAGMHFRAVSTPGLTYDLDRPNDLERAGRAYLIAAREAPVLLARAV